jgi:Domain of unknown function (DUF5666)
MRSGGVISMLRHSAMAAPLRTMVCSAAVCALLACGGGGSTSVSALPGTGGTGVTAVNSVGPVAGFGSVIVNSTRFDETGAQIQIDGSSATAAELRLGMVANITGSKFSATVATLSSELGVGKADRIEVWSIAQGAVTGLALPNTFTVAGMTMVTSAGTVLDGIMATANLSTGSIVKVWGQPATADLRQWSVTRLEVLASPAETVSTGIVSFRGAVADLNGLVLTGTTGTLKNGQEIRASGKLGASGTRGTLTASKVTVLVDTDTAPAASGYAELQGVVSSALSTNTSTTPPKLSRLSLGASVIDIQSATLSPDNAIIKQGSRIEVEGTWNAGVLIASKVEVKTEQQSLEVEIEAVIEQFTSVANFVVRGQRCDASGLTSVGNGRLTDLKLGTRVELHGRKSGDVVRVTELEIK